MDTSTPEGRAKFTEEYHALCEMAPELMKKEDLIFPHELPAPITQEPHF